MIMDIAGETVNVIMADDMPIGMPEHIWKNADDSYTLKLNAKYDQETLQTAFEHAADHIRNGDYDKSDVQQIEMEAHGLTDVTPEQTEKQLPEWIVEIVYDLTLRLEAAKCVAAYYKDMARIQSAYYEPWFTNDQQSAFNAAEDKWLYDV